jgi:LysM repeat protein
MRTNGMELVGTEVEPDWHAHGGNYEEGVTVAIRATNDAAIALVASEDEVSRASRHNADPEKRFHYRYQAAALAWEAAKLMPNNFEDATSMLCTAGGWLNNRDSQAADAFYFQAAALAWEAAKLMPDNSENTARVLCIAGGWIKYRDPQKADLFYKALVRRNRKTAIGMEADRIRWFPKLDEQGNVIPRKTSRPASMQPPTPPEPSAGQASDPPVDRAAREYPIPGKPYVIHVGDSLASIARAANIFGQPISMEELLKANPGLDPAQLLIGQKIMIPGSTDDGSTTPAPDGSTPAPAMQSPSGASSGPAPP